jgi:hypothetical protein
MESVDISPEKWKTFNLQLTTKMDVTAAFRSYICDALHGSEMKALVLDSDSVCFAGFLEL